jgi:hypothetical protein
MIGNFGVYSPDEPACRDCQHNEWEHLCQCVDDCPHRNAGKCKVDGCDCRRFRERKLAGGVTPSQERARYERALRGEA